MSKQWGKLYFGWLIRRRFWINTWALIFTVLMAALASRLQLKTSFSELLPEKLPSVVALKKVSERLGGASFLSVGVESPDFEANKKFVEELALKLQPLVGHSLRYFEYKYDDVIDYFHRYGLHYLGLDNLKRLHADIQAQIEAGEDEAAGLGSPAESDPSKKLTSEDIANDLDPQFKLYTKFREGYLSARDGKLLVISLRPFGSSLSIDESKKLVDEIQAMIDGMNPKNFHPEMKVNLTGSVKTAISEFQTIKDDILGTALLLVALILGVLYLFFWSVRWVLFLCANLVFAVIWTFGITQVHIGYLNTQTAFLGSLVVGTGINYGIIFIYRFLESRRRGQNLEAAIEESISATSIATLIASASTAIAFLSLLLANNKGLSQFGFIGCLGVALCWITAYSLLPLWIYQFESKWPARDIHHPLGKMLEQSVERFGSFITRHATAFGIALGISSVVGTLIMLPLIHNPEESNFDNLRNRIAKDSGTEAIERGVNEVYSTSTTPAIVLLDTLQQAEEFCGSVKALATKLPPDENIIHSCMSIYSILPEAKPQKNERLVEMQKVIDILQNKSLKLSKDWKKIKEFKDHLTLEEPTIEQLPFQLTRRFTDRSGNIGTVAFVNPDSSKPLNDGKNLLAFTNSISSISLEKTNTVVSGAGDSFILADLMRGLRRDGPLTSAVSLVAVILLAIFLAGGIRTGLIICGCLLFGTWWLLCIQGALGIKYNFFNFIALPLTFGIGVDYPVNVFIRCQEEGFRRYGKVLSTTGPAVLLCALTTIIGYYTLLDATNLALVSFAKLALIGEITCVIAAFVFLPVLLHFWKRMD